MSDAPSILVSSTACVLALMFSSGAFAQQTTRANATSTTAPDNTAMTQRDRSSTTMTLLDQPNNKSEIKLAAAARQALVKDESLSVSAHNLKLVAVDGLVTLRSPVSNADEKARVETVVRAVAGLSRVDNQLDIKTP